jgi:hypothetical protein
MSNDLYTGEELGFPGFGVQTGYHLVSIDSEMEQADFGRVFFFFFPVCCFTSRKLKGYLVKFTINL